MGDWQGAPKEKKKNVGRGHPHQRRGGEKKKKKSGTVLGLGEDSDERRRRRTCLRGGENTKPKKVKAVQGIKSYRF